MAYLLLKDLVFDLFVSPILGGVSGGPKIKSFSTSTFACGPTMQRTLEKPFIGHVLAKRPHTDRHGPKAPKPDKTKMRWK
eukprot:2006962-Amphidinium_carterae.1